MDILVIISGPVVNVSGLASDLSVILRFSSLSETAMAVDGGYGCTREGANEHLWRPLMDTNGR